MGQFGLYGGHKGFFDAIKDRMWVTMTRRDMDEREVLKSFIKATLPGGGLLTLVGAPAMLNYLLSQGGAEKRDGASEQRL